MKLPDPIEHSPLTNALIEISVLKQELFEHKLFVKKVAESLKDLGENAQLNNERISLIYLANLALRAQEKRK